MTEAIYDAGFGSSGRFYDTSTAVLGMTPTDYRAGAKGLEIRFAAATCWLGVVMVAQTARGVCAILLGDDAETLMGDLRDRFPGATFVGGDASFERTVATVVGFVERPSTSLELPLDVQGTAFQQRVWEVLRTIPPGSTATYTEIAVRLGKPTGARAVARACASNPVAVVIPCHRVVRGDGALSGYRWGIGRKRALLDKERAK